MQNEYFEIVKSIIKAQMAIIGPMAIEEANKTGCITVDANFSQITISTDPKEALERLVRQYAELFGSISIEVSKEATQQIVKAESAITLPNILDK